MEHYLIGFLEGSVLSDVAEISIGYNVIKSVEYHKHCKTLE